MTTAKTSRSHPLRVDNLAVGGLSGVIGLTFCPGKKQRGALSGDWDRDLAADLEAIKSSGAKALVTLMAGQLWGAMNGMDGIPHVWVSALDVLSPLLHLARQLLRICNTPNR
jgi:hypothetical protein